jgi:hypothetical protein
MSYHDTAWAESEIASARNKGNGKPLANNTRLFANEDGSYRIRLHNTDIITINSDGTYTLNSGGYQTVTTMERLRRFTPVRLMSISGDWYVRTEPNPQDPKPERVDRTIPKPFTPGDHLGDEPVKNDEGCQAGSMMGTDHVDEEVRIFRKDMQEGDVIVKDEGSGDKYDFITVTRTWTTWVFYGEEAHSYRSKEWEAVADKSHTKYEQCPHCKAFDAEHERWRQWMHGDRWGRRFDRQRGYATYIELMERFHNDKALWQEAYLTDFRERRAYMKADREWEERNRVPFFDGITIDSDGYAPRLRKSGPSPAKLRRHEKEVKRVKNEIDKYVGKFMAALKEGMAMPGSGDCWMCLMKTDKGETLGDLGDNSHLWDHIEEDYFVPSLITNALLERGYKPLGVYMMLDMDQDAQTMGGGRSSYNGAKRDLRKYMQKRLVPAAPTE